MSNKLLNRIVGIIIIIICSVIVLPIILDGKKKDYKDKSIAIPLVLKNTETVSNFIFPLL